MARQLSEDHISPITREKVIFNEKVKEVSFKEKVKEVNFKDKVKEVKRRSSLDTSLVR